MKYFSMFSGIGGFELGIEKANIAYEQEWESDTTQQGSCSKKRGKPQLSSCVGFSEIDKYAIQIYQKHFPRHKLWGNCRDIVCSELPDFDLLVGGFPCQSFSIAGKRGGFEDTRGTLFFEIARIVRVKKPKLLLLENVKGLLSHDTGRTFGTILATLFDLGYVCEWQILNSKDFGVPQNRERVFIIGHLGGIGSRTVFPIGECNERIDESNGKRTQANISNTIDSRTGSYPKWGQYVMPVLTPDRAEKRQNGRRFKEDGDPSFTLTSQDIHGVMTGQRIRRLTPTECERLQGFPDGWTAGISDSQRYKCLGNAVTVNVIEAVIGGIYDNLD